MDSIVSGDMGSLRGGVGWGRGRVKGKLAKAHQDMKLLDFILK